MHRWVRPCGCCLAQCLTRTVGRSPMRMSLTRGRPCPCLRPRGWGAPVGRGPWRSTSGATAAMGSRSIGASSPAPPATAPSGPAALPAPAAPTTTPRARSRSPRRSIACRLSSIARRARRRLAGTRPATPCATRTGPTPSTSPRPAAAGAGGAQAPGGARGTRGHELPEAVVVAPVPEAVAEPGQGRGGERVGVGGPGTVHGLHGQGRARMNR